MVAKEESGGLEAGHERAELQQERQAVDEFHELVPAGWDPQRQIHQLIQLYHLLVAHVQLRLHGRRGHHTTAEHSRRSGEAGVSAVYVQAHDPHPEDVKIQ